jgi:hypothetical protein
MITMLLGGLWHGAGWTFLAWGALQGIGLTVNHAWRSWRGERPDGAVRRLGGWLLTFAAFAVGMVFFRAPTMDAALSLLRSMAGTGDPLAPAGSALEWDAWGVAHGYFDREWILAWLGSAWSMVGSMVTLVALAIALFVPDTLEITGYAEQEPHALWRRNPRLLKWRPSLFWLGVTAATVLVALFQLGRVSEFLYYQF